MVGLIYSSAVRVGGDNGCVCVSGVAVWLCVVIGAVFIPTAMSQQSLLPSLPASQEESSMANLWRHALRQQKTPAGVALRSEEPGMCVCVFIIFRS